MKTRDTIPAPAPAERDRLIASLAEVGINTGFVRAVIEGLAAGEVWTPPGRHADATYVRHGYGMSLIWGSDLRDAFEEIVDYLIEGADLPHAQWLQIDPRWAHLPWAESLQRAAPHAGIDVDTRVNFTFDSARYAQVRSDILIPEGWEIRAADATDYDFSGSVVPSAFWPDANQFLNHGGGWRAQRGDTVGALAFSSFPLYDGGIEIGIETLPAARRHGLGAAVAAAMIDDALLTDRIPLWACRQGNTASYQLATRLGFTPTRTLPCINLTRGALS